MIAGCVDDYVEGDTGTVMVTPCKNGDGNIIDLTGALSVKLQYKINNGTLQSKNMTVNFPPAAGIAQYQFLSGELIRGEMIGAVEITDVNGGVVTEVCLFTRNIRKKLV